MKCLVVDDSLVIRRILSNALRRVGCETILEAADGKQALELCDASVDLVITDWNMPALDGIELVRRLRKKPETSGVKILMVTSRNGRDDVLQAVQSGVNGYLLHPLNLESLTESILRLMPQEDVASGETPSASAASEGSVGTDAPPPDAAAAVQAEAPAAPATQAASAAGSQ